MHKRLINVKNVDYALFMGLDAFPGRKAHE